MENRILHSVTGLFHSADEITQAAKEVNKAGYKKFDIHTPYPVHGLEKAMKLKRSTLGYIAFILSAIGAISAILLMWWTMSVSYPLNISGKPFFSLPAFVPIMFELAVLTASVVGVVLMLTIFFRFPNHSHPLHDTEYMKAVSSDKYGMVIESDDPQFDIDKAKSFLSSIGATDIGEVYWDNNELTAKKTIFDKKFIFGLVGLAIIVSGGTYWLLNKAMFKEPFNWMMYQQKLSAQSPTTFFKDGFSMREPVEGTVARGYMPYPYPADSAVLAEKYLVNPLEPTVANLNAGKAKFNTFCSPCHDYHGTGQSRLNGQFPNPPSLQSDRVRNWKDGHIFHIITMGQNTMPSYAKTVNETERWQIVLYVRALERAMNAKLEDLK